MTTWVIVDIVCVLGLFHTISGYALLPVISGYSLSSILSSADKRICFPYFNILACLVMKSLYS